MAAIVLSPTANIWINWWLCPVELRGGSEFVTCSAKQIKLLMRTENVQEMCVMRANHGIQLWSLAWFKSQQKLHIKIHQKGESSLFRCRRLHTTDSVQWYPYSHIKLLPHLQFTWFWSMFAYSSIIIRPGTDVGQKVRQLLFKPSRPTSGQKPLKYSYNWLTKNREDTPKSDEILLNLVAVTVAEANARQVPIIMDLE